MKLKKIICWPPLLGGVGAGVTIGILAYITFQSILSGTNYGLWLAASFGSSVVVVFGYPDNDFAGATIFDFVHNDNNDYDDALGFRPEYVDYGNHPGLNFNMEFLKKRFHLCKTKQ